MYGLFLYAMLADPVFEVRESAEAKLIQLVDRSPEVYGPQLGAWVLEATEPEIVSRMRKPLTVYARHHVTSFAPKSVPVWPRIDMQPRPLPFGICALSWSASWECEWIEAIEPWLEWMEPPQNQWPYMNRHRAATERMIRDRLRLGMTHAEADSLLVRMWRLEQRYASSNEMDEWKAWAGGYPQPK